MTEKKRRAVVEVAAFAAKALASRYPVLVGIDPGNSGALAFACGDACVLIDIPVHKTKAKKSRRNSYEVARETGVKSRTINATDIEFDLPAICELFALLDPVKSRVRIMLEKIPVSIGRGRKYADVMINRAYAMWPLFLFQKGFKLYQARPSDWKAHFGLLYVKPKGTSKKEAEKAKRKNKVKSKEKALKYFPAADPYLQLVQDHDKAEALLLIVYLRKVLRHEESADDD